MDRGGEGGGREGGREGGTEGRRDGRTKVRTDEERDGRTEGWRDGGTEGRREEVREGGRYRGIEGGRQGRGKGMGEEIRGILRARAQGWHGSRAGGRKSCVRASEQRGKEGWEKGGERIASAFASAAGAIGAYLIAPIPARERDKEGVGGDGEGGGLGEEARCRLAAQRPPVLQLLCPMLQGCVTTMSVGVTITTVRHPCPPAPMLMRANLPVGPPLPPPAAEGLARRIHRAAQAMHLVREPLPLIVPATLENVFSVPLAVSAVKIAYIEVAVWVNVTAGAVPQAVNKFSSIATTRSVVVGTASMLFVIVPVSFVHRSIRKDMSVKSRRIHRQNPRRNPRRSKWYRPLFTHGVAAESGQNKRIA